MNQGRFNLSLGNSGKGDRRRLLFRRYRGCGTLHHFVAEVVDDFHGDVVCFGCREGQGEVAVEGRPRVFSKDHQLRERRVILQCARKEIGLLSTLSVFRHLLSGFQHALDVQQPLLLLIVLCCLAHELFGVFP